MSHSIQANIHCYQGHGVGVRATIIWRNRLRHPIELTWHKTVCVCHAIFFFKWFKHPFKPSWWEGIKSREDDSERQGGLAEDIHKPDGQMHLCCIYFQRGCFKWDKSRWRSKNKVKETMTLRTGRTVCSLISSTSWYGAALWSNTKNKVKIMY